MHGLLVWVLWGMRPEDMGIVVKKESERIKTRLVRLVREVEKGEEKKIPVKEPGADRTKSGPLKYEIKTTEVKFFDKLPDISPPKISRPDIISERKVLFIDKKKDKIDIKKITRRSGESGDDIKVKFTEPDDYLKESMDKKDPLMIDEKITEDIDAIIIVPGSDKEGTKKGGLPGGLLLEGIVGGRGKVIWDKNNKIPTYPEEAEKNGWEGNVRLKLTVHISGKVRLAFIEEKSGYSVLDRAAKRQARTWKIYIVEGGIKIPGTVIISIPFELKK